MYRRPCRSSIQIPSAWRIADRHGVDTDCRKKTRASRSTSTRVGSSSWVSDQARRRSERLVSPSASASASLGIIAHSFRSMMWTRMVNPQNDAQYQARQCRPLVRSRIGTRTEAVEKPQEDGRHRVKGVTSHRTTARWRSATWRWPCQARPLDRAHGPRRSRPRVEERSSNQVS